MFKVTKVLAPAAISSLFLQCSNNRHTYPLSNNFQIVTAINPRLKTIADG